MNCRRIYLDSNVFISLVREEINGAFNLRFKDSETFLVLCKKNEIEIALSALFFEEVEGACGLKEEVVLEIMNSHKVNCVLIGKDKEPSIKALEIQKQNKLHLSDAIHTALALESGAEFIITWNKKDFEKVKELIECKSPLDFIQGFL